MHCYYKQNINKYDMCLSLSSINFKYRLKFNFFYQKQIPVKKKITSPVGGF